MLRASGWLLAGLVLVAGTRLVRAQDDESRALVLKAMEAHGGKEMLNKYKAAQVKMKGEIEIMGMQAKFSGEVFILFPHKMKNAITIEINNMNIDVTQVFDGKQMFVKAAGNSIEIKDAALLDEVKETMYVEKVAGLMDLDDKEYKLSALGEAKVNDKAAVGVRVTREGKRDVNLFFDKGSHLLVKYEFRGKDPFGMGAGEVTQEKVLSDYKEIKGIKTATKMIINHDGKKTMDLEISDVTYAETFDDSYFTKP